MKFSSYFVLTRQMKRRIRAQNKGNCIGIIFNFDAVLVFAQLRGKALGITHRLERSKGSIYSGENVVITGKIVDHSYKPIRGAEVLIRTGTDTTKAFTDPHGVFRGEFKEFQKIPGTYTVNVIASWYGMTGLASTQFQVKGDLSPESVLEEKLSSEEAQRYLSAEESDFEKNPIGLMLFKHYHKMLEELIEEKKKTKQFQHNQVFLEQQRRISENLREQAIDEFNPRYGTFEGNKYQYYINSLDPKIREMVASQLNFTKNTFEEAQQIREEILANGGTEEEARQAYIEIISIPKEILEQFNQEQLNKDTDKNDDANQDKDKTSHNQ